MNPDGKEYLCFGLVSLFKTLTLLNLAELGFGLFLGGWQPSCQSLEACLLSNIDPMEEVECLTVLDEGVEGRGFSPSPGMG